MKWEFFKNINCLKKFYIELTNIYTASICWLQNIHCGFLAPLWATRFTPLWVIGFIPLEPINFTHLWTINFTHSWATRFTSSWTTTFVQHRVTVGLKNQMTIYYRLMKNYFLSMDSIHLYDIFCMVKEIFIFKFY